MNYPATSSASILCVGMGWFPQTPSGLNRYLYELTHQLVRDRDQVEVCGVGLPTIGIDSNVRLTNLASPDSSLMQRLWSTRHHFSQRQLRSPDAINFHFALYSYPLLQTLPQNAPLTFTFHGPWGLESQAEGHGSWNQALKQWMESQVFRRCDRFIVLSKAFGKILHETYHVPWNHIHVIPGGVDTTRFQPNLSRYHARAHLNFPQDRPILFTPRRLVKRMGLEHLISAIDQVRQAVPDVWLAIAGKGYLQDSLEQHIRDLGLEHHIQLLGYLPDDQLPIAYQAADLSVVPSQSLEGFGLILLESLACGTPVLCTPVGGMPEVVSPLCPNLVTDTPDPAAIAHRLIDFLSARSPLPSRTECRDYAYQNFDWKTIAPQVRRVLLRNEG